ncbi:MAG: chemotaxis protein CheA [Phycisphaerales bacterium]|nr:chemotaxis protein CheA [Phycisphaerales bacterium]
MNPSVDVTPELLAGFLDEAPEYLSMLDSGLLAFEGQAASGSVSIEAPEDHARMNEMFRAAHSLKGLAAAMGFERIRDLTHLMETLFDEVRMGKRALEADAFETLFSVFDKLRSLVGELASPGQTPAAIDAELEALSALLARSGAPRDGASKPTLPQASPPQTPGDGSAASDPSLLQLFVESTAETVELLSECLLRLEQQSTDADVLNEVFRCAHNIKGATGAMGFNGLYRFTHQMETVLDRLRSHQTTLGGGLMDALLGAVDVLRQVVEKAKAGQCEDLTDGSAETLFAPFLKEPDVKAAAMPDTAEADPGVAGRAAEPDGMIDREPTWRVEVVFKAGSSEAPIHAYLIKNKLEERGDVIATAPDIETVDAVANLERMTYTLRGEVNAEELRQVIARYDVSDVSVLPGSPQAAPPRSADPDSASPPPAASSASHSAGAVLPGAAQTSNALAPDPTASCESTDLADIAALANQARALAESGATPGTRGQTAPPFSRASTAPTRPSPAEKPANAEGRDASGTSKAGETIRVDLERLDQLMNLGGELVISKARFVQIHNRLAPVLTGKNAGYLLDDVAGRMESLKGCVSRLGEQNADGKLLADMRDAMLHLTRDCESIRGMMEQVHSSRGALNDFGEALHSLSRISEGLQKRIMETRMVSIGPLLNRFRRVVRDIAKSTGKDVALELRGENTELDKRMIDELGDPLTHMVRNSVDHGLESPEDRVRAGKSPTGNILLNAYHRGRFICIEVRDDGRGINVDAIRRKIVERELATPQQAEALSDRELIQYIFHPGFSTAAKVTDLSGRGMGMDIVKTKIEALNGTIEVDSTPGQGACVTIKLPLTLAIITALLSRIGDGTYAIPLESVAEIITVPRNEIQSVQQRRMIRVRDRVMPMALFEEVFDAGPEGLHTKSGGNDDLTLVIIEFKDQRLGLVVDDLIGQEEVVIKSLATNYRNITGISGASIMGDGSVALILDVSTMMQMFGAKGAPSADVAHRSTRSATLSGASA